MKILTTGEMVDEQPLKGMGDAAIGIISGWHYDVSSTIQPTKSSSKPT